MMDWIAQHEELLAWLGVFSVVTFLGSLAAVPIVIARLPEDYFLPRDKRSGLADPRHVFLHTAKHVLGGILILMGILMLFLPGQGLLTILIGFSLLDFPGKRRVQLRLLRPTGMRRAIAWIRAKSGAPPLRYPVDPARSS